MHTIPCYIFKLKSVNIFNKKLLSKKKVYNFMTQTPKTSEKRFVMPLLHLFFIKSNLENENRDIPD